MVVPEKILMKKIKKREKVKKQLIANKQAKTCTDESESTANFDRKSNEYWLGLFIDNLQSYSFQMNRDSLSGVSIIMQTIKNVRQKMKTKFRQK